MKQNVWRSTWTSKSIYVDVHTGEKLDEKTAKQNYVILKTRKHAQRSKMGSGGITTYTHECERNRQTELPFGNK